MMNQMNPLSLGVLIVASTVSLAPAALMVHYRLDDDGAGGLSNLNSGSATHAWNSSAGATLITGKFGGAGRFLTSSAWWSNSSTGVDLSSFTLSMHVRENTGVANFLNWQDFVSIGDGNLSVFKFEYNGAHQGASVYTTGTPGGGTATIGGASGPDVNGGAWHHLAMVSNGITLELFVDGISQGSAAYTGSGPITALQIAAQFGGGRDQNVDVDDLALYDLALAPDQVAWLTNNEATANPIPEPFTGSLLGVGALAFLVRRRK